MVAARSLKRVIKGVHRDFSDQVAQPITGVGAADGIL